MKVDYYVGIRPTTLEQRIIFHGIFTKWYEIIDRQVDTKIISVTTRVDLVGKVLRKLQYLSGAHIIGQRRKGSLLHIVSILVANPTDTVVCRRPLVVSCFDAIPFESNASELAGSLVSRTSKRRLSAFIKLMGRADRVITLSEHAKNRISEICQIALDKIDIVYLAVDHDQFHPQPIGNAPEKMCEFGFDPEKQNLLYVGSENPRKNLERVIRALPLVRDELDIRLVKVGNPQEPFHTRLRKLVCQLNLEDAVRFCASIAHDQLPVLYNLADLFVFPSLYEGFGLPPLEALACGCPVVTSNETSLPEVVGDAAEKVDPYDHTSIAAGILKVLSDEKYRQDLVEKGKRQALKFSWGKTARDTLGVYHKVL